MTDLIPVILDFETYYDSDYSLGKMPTMQYLRDPRFKCLGCAVKLPGQDSVWLEPDALPAFFDALPWDRIMMVAHNTQFDGALLVEHYGHRPARYACTMLMLRYLVAQGVLDPEQTTSAKAAAPLVGLVKGDLDASLEDGTLDAYATMDADICAALLHQYWRKLPQVERDYIHIHVQAAAEPVFDLDRDRLQALADADKAMESMFPIVRKDDKFAALLDTLGVAPEWKTTPKGTYKLATSKKDGFMQKLHEHPDARVRKLAEIRAKASSTIERTRSQRFLDVGAPLPAPLLYYGAHTARSSGCLVADTKVTVRDPDRGVLEKRITDVLPDDLVWDGVTFVSHDGVKFSGYREVIEHDGIVGTPDHPVFTETGETVGLAGAKARGIVIARGGEVPRDRGQTTPTRALEHLSNGG
jgi:hypothetical protein